MRLRVPVSILPCWQTWHEGGMAMRCGTSENVAVPAQHGLNGRNGLELPAASGPLPETIPVPEAQNGGKAATPGLLEPSRSEPLPGTGTAKDAPQHPPQDKDPVPAGKDPVPTGKGLVPTGKDPVPASKDPVPASIDPVPASIDPVTAGKDPVPTPENPHGKPPLPPPQSSSFLVEPISAAPGVTIPSSFFAELPPTAGSMNPLPISEAVPAAFFTHGRVPQASADSGSPHNDNDCAHFAP